MRTQKNNVKKNKEYIKKLNIKGSKVGKVCLQNKRLERKTENYAEVQCKCDYNKDDR